MSSNAVVTNNTSDKTTATNYTSQQTKSGANTTDTAQNQALGQQGGIESVTYSRTQISSIQTAAQLNGVKTVYVPTIVLQGDAFQNAGGQNTSPKSIPKDGTLSIVYHQMVINESNNAITGGGVIMERQGITLRNNIAAEWLEVQGKAGAPSWVLSFKDGNTHINMSTRGTKAQTVNIANSFVPLKSSSPSLLPPEIVSAQQLYPPVSSGVLICTNYFNAPTWNVMVMAGSNPATPHKGEFILESGSLSKTISLPSQDGIPTLAGFSRTSVTFTTSTGASGTLNYRTGTLNMNH